MDKNRNEFHRAEQTNGQMDKRTNGQMDKLVNAQNTADKWTNGQADGRTNGQACEPALSGSIFQNFRLVGLPSY
jgi:hypothetical protein